MLVIFKIMSINSVIESAGIEYECGLPYKKYKRVVNFFTKWNLANRLLYERDGSVSVPPKNTNTHDFFNHREMYGDWRYNAEVAFWSDKKIDLNHFLSYMNKIGSTTNDSCGMHVHFKFKDMAKATAVFASCTARRQFNDLFIQYANTQPEENSRRLLGRLTNHMCRPSCDQTIIENQLKSNSRKPSSRYYSVNLAALYSHGTIEIRLLPGVDWPYNKENLNWLIKAVTKVITTHQNKRKVSEHYALVLYKLGQNYAQGASFNKMHEIYHWLPYNEEIERYYNQFLNGSRR
jgi:hypothetical protein